MAYVLSAFLVSLVISLFLVRHARLRPRFGVDFDTTGVQKYHANPVPRVGGISILLGMIPVCAIAYERDPEAFTAKWKKDEDRTRKRIVAARRRLAGVLVPDTALERAAQLCMALGTDGLRGELTLMRAARALAALDGVAEVGDVQLRQVARPALRHRLRRDPLDESDATVRVDRALAELFPA